MMTEKNIADKLNNLSVPDWKNVVWQRVNGMLDTHPDSSMSIEKDRSNFSKQHILGIITCIMVIIIILLITKKKQLGKQKETVPTQKQQQSKNDGATTHPAISNRSKASTEKRTQSEKQNKLITDSISKVIIYPGTSSNDTLSKDSNIKQTAVSTISADSISNFRKDSVTIIKKNKGFKGLSDSSYKIIPVKKN